MSARRLLTGSLVIAVTAAAFWLIGTSDNPLREATHTGWITSRERLSPDRAPAQDPLAQFASSLVDPPAEAAVEGRVYVPAYAQIRLGSGRGMLDLATTLSIHNSSAEHAIVLRKVSYHGTDGALVEAFLDRPVGLKPLATIEFFVAAADLRAGSGANFVIAWAAPAAVSEPVAEAVMIGTIGTTSYAFVSQGRTSRPTAGE